jgi:hypothetical protein
MKKILVVLLVLAAATGVFAQDGEWSLGGNVEIGSYVDFSGDDIMAGGSTYNLPYGGWGPIHGTLGVGYSLDALKVGITFDTTRDELFWGDISYDAGNYALAAYTNLTKLLNGGSDEQRLWGYYKLLNEMVTLEVAFKSRDTQYWISDTTGAFTRAPDFFQKRGWNYDDAEADQMWGFGSPISLTPWAETATFAKVDKTAYILADVNLSNLEFGVLLPNIFPSTKGYGTNSAGDPTVNLLEGVMKKTLIGLKFNMQPVEVAAQFQMGSYGVYFGGKWFIGPVTAGLSFSGILDPDDPNKRMRFGGGVEFNPGSFGAWVKGFYGLGGTTSTRTTQIGIEPGFFYNVIPSHLQFRTNVGFYFTGGKASGEKKDLEVGWAVQPELFWNFLGTGAGTYWSYGTGMIVRYRLVADKQGAMNVNGEGKTNALDVNFKFSF